MKKNQSFYEIYKKDKQNSWFSRLAFSCFNLLFSLDKTMEKIPLFDKWIKIYGLEPASSKFLSSLKIKVERVGFKRLNNKNAYLIFGNHPTLIDPLVVLSVIKQDNTQIVAGDNVTKIGPNFSKYIFPIKNLQIIDNKPRKVILLDWLYPIFFKSIAEYHKREDALTYNRNQTNKAADFLARGGKLLIFPGGQEKISKETMANGIGFILSRTIKKQAKNVKILSFFVDIGHPNLFMLKALFKLRKKPIKIKIFFDHEVDASCLRGCITKPKEITRKLEKDYINFQNERMNNH